MVSCAYEGTVVTMNGECRIARYMSLVVLIWNLPLISPLAFNQPSLFSIIVVPPRWSGWPYSMTDFPRLARSAAKAHPQGPAPMMVTDGTESRFVAVMMDEVGAFLECLCCSTRRIMIYSQKLFGEDQFDSIEQRQRQGLNIASLPIMDLDPTYGGRTRPHSFFQNMPANYLLIIRTRNTSGCVMSIILASTMRTRCLHSAGDPFIYMTDGTSIAQPIILLFSRSVLRHDEIRRTSRVSEGCEDQDHHGMMSTICSTPRLRGMVKCGSYSMSLVEVFSSGRS